mmetsp:Transcript_93123/g.182471  ORF Transcript_93123/g.182471 Transcript_93123/m.182471 type:complete len:953 (+) Transcript_93123:89-2947(+)
MIHSISGLNVEQVGLVVHSLSQAGCEDLASLYITCLAMIDAMLVVLLKEMFSTRKHILYWNQLAKSSQWELLLYIWNSKLFKLLFTQKDRDYLILDESDLMLKHAEMLRCDLDDMSILLNHICTAGADLKAIYMQLSSMGGTVSDSLRKENSALARNHSEVELTTLPPSSSVAEIGVQLGLSMSAKGSLAMTRPELNTDVPINEAPTLGLSIQSEDDDEHIVGVDGIKILQDKPRYRFHSKEEEREDELKLIREMARRRIESCLLSLALALSEYLPHLMPAAVGKEDGDWLNASAALASASVPQKGENGDCTVKEASRAYYCLNPTGKRENLTVADMEMIFCCLEDFIDRIRSDRGHKEFPLQFTQARVHKPSDRERYWFRSILFGLGCSLCVKMSIEMWHDGTIAHAYSFVLGKLRDHVQEPMEKLARELFDTIRKRDYVVTREECEESQEALHRMLFEFSQTSKGSTLISDMKTRIRDTLREQQEAASAMASKISNRGGIAEGGSNSGISGGGISNGAGAGSGDGASKLAATLVAAEFSPEQAMAALMTAYERELQAPVQGVLFGNLMTAILIQMQKLKVHTEAAMLTMDQILDSNELTITAMAAMPAFGFLGMALFWLKKWMQPRAAAPGLATVHLRLIMSDVERSLQEVHELTCFNESRSIINDRRAVSSSSRTNKINSSSSLQYVTSPSAKSKTAMDSSSNVYMRGRSLSVSSADEGQVLESKLQSYQKKLEARRILIAKGLLSFNLVRFRSEFQNLFGTSRYAVVSGEKGRSLSMMRESTSRDHRQFSSAGFGRFGLRSTFVPYFDHKTAMASTVRKWRMGRSASITSMLASRGIDAHQQAADLDAGRTTLIAELLAIMQREECADWRGQRARGVWKVLSTAGDILRAIYRMLFTAGEELTATTQYASLSRDIAILEAPEMEVSLEQKLNTAARMRATYTCLMPHK